MSSMLWDTRGLKLLRNFLPVIVGYAGGIYFAVQHLTARRMDPVTFLLWRDAYVPGWYLTPFIISVAFFTIGILLNLLWLVILVKLEVDES